MGDGIDKTVMVLAAPHLPHQEDRVHHHSCNQKSKEHDPEKQQHTLAPIEDDPTDVKRNCQRDQADASDDEENDRSTPTGDPHSLRFDSIALANPIRINEKAPALGRSFSNQTLANRPLPKTLRVLLAGPVAHSEPPPDRALHLPTVRALRPKPSQVF